MHRVLIVGSGGAGKSTFAARLASRTGLPLIHLDSCYWREGWVATPKDEWTQRVDELVRGTEWVMDGNYGGTLDTRIAACDTIVFLDLPRLLCIRRVIHRWWRYRGRSRPDMTPGCHEQLSLEFLRWIWEYPATRRPDILRRLAALRPDQQSIVLRTPADVEAFFDADLERDVAARDVQ
jgi:adenylate kinase family enzyme